MIDTDKYEGHTPAPWFPFDGTDSHGYGWEIRLPTHKHDADSINTKSVGSHHIGIGVRKKRLSEPNARLIADAPLLLEEVKRLQEENMKQLDVLSKLDEMIRFGNDHVEMMKALEQGLDLTETWKEMIE